ncbi:MAG: MFS transporter [Clostridia bacterium]
MKKDNLRLYPIYRSISADLIFYYSIYLLFLTQIKGLATTDVVLGGAFFSLFCVLIQIPILMIADNLGNKKSIILGNIFNSISIVLILLCTSLPQLIISQLFSAIAFSLKGTCESSLLTDSLPYSKKKGGLVAKLDGAGLSLYYYINAVSSIISGFVFHINGYIPIAICLSITVISTILSLRFKEVKKEKLEQNITLKKEIKLYLKNLKKSFKFIFRSKRLKGLLIFSGIFAGIINLLMSYDISLLNELNISPIHIGLMFAVFGVLSGVASNRQNKIHEKLKNKTLAFISIIYMLACLISGLITIFDTTVTTLVIIFFAYAIRYYNIGLFNISIKRYLGNFTTDKISSKIYAVNYLVQNFFRAIICFAGSMLLTFTKTTNIAMLIVGCIGVLAMFMVTLYMKSRVGLKADEYNKNDIEFES